MNWYLQVLKKYAEFSGRARRTEYWMFALFNFIFLIVAVIIDNIAGTTIEGLPYGLFYFLYALAVLIPGLAVLVRRLHDVGKSGWMFFIALIPIVGAIWLLVLMVTDSNPGANEYGSNPKESYSVDNMENNTLLTSNSNDSSTGDTLVLIAVIWMFINRLFWAVLPKLIDNVYSAEWFKSINAVMGLIWAVIPIGLAFAIKDKSKQIILFILGGIYLLYGLYETIMQFIK
jgi:uncharacterized membrane protein YhaH (DUF805 family)